MRDIVWSDDALRDFEHAISHVASESVRAASLIADRIEIAVERLADMPTGRPGRVKGTYEKLVPNTPYILAYALSDHAVTIVGIIHGSREWLENAWPEEP